MDASPIHDIDVLRGNRVLEGAKALAKQVLNGTNPSEHGLWVAILY